MRVAEGSQLGDAFAAVGKRSSNAIAADTRFQRKRTNIHSTNDPGHGNLPCMCD
jgi:hypothetical protein